MLYSYVPSLVKCRIFGVELEGLSQENFVTIERMNDVTTFRKSQDGKHTAFVDRYGSYRVTLSLSQVSASNEWIHMLFKLYQKAGVNLKIPLEVEEKISEGGTKFTAFDCFFENEAPTTFSSESGDKQWIFVCHNGTYTQKGTVNTNEALEAMQSIVRLIELAGSFGVDLSNFSETITTGFNVAQEKLKNLF